MFSNKKSGEKNKLKKRNGETLIELVMTIFIIGTILLLATQDFSNRNIIYDRTLYEIKSELRNMSLKSIYTGQINSMIIGRNEYEVRIGNKVVCRKRLPPKTYLFSEKRKIEYNIRSRTGAPVLGGTLYFFDKKDDKLTKITVMLGSGRVRSYKIDSENEKKQLKNMLGIN